MNNFEMLKFAESFLGKGGSTFRSWAGLGKKDPYCNAYVSYIFAKTDNSQLYCDGRKETYCPHSIAWCRNNLAMIPIYLAMPSDVIYFDWQPNDIPDHIGFVVERISDLEIETIEGNTSGGVVAERTRSYKDVQAVFRPHFPVTFEKPGILEEDGYFGYHTIATTQYVLGITVDGILGQQTVKAIQKAAGCDQDGSWGPLTVKAVQKMIGTPVDGFFGPASVKAFQRWVNAKFRALGETQIPATPAPVTSSKTLGDKIAETAKSYVGKVKYKKGGTSLKTGVDCTGFIQAIYGLNGIQLSPYLKTWGKSMGTDISKAVPGDILTYRKGSSYHHAIYIGSKMICHAANAKQGICISKYNSVGKPLYGIRRRWK